MTVINYGSAVVSKYVARACPSCGCNPCGCGGSASLDTAAVDYLSDLMGSIPDPLNVASTAAIPPVVVGASGTFTTLDGLTVTVVDGIITEIV